MNETRGDLDRYGRHGIRPPRPVAIMQSNDFAGMESVTICAFTTDDTEAPLFRIAFEPNERNGLREPCRLMVDKITTVPKSRLGVRVGRLDDEDIVKLNRSTAR
jgi:mRNA interferase MazF